MKKQITAFFLLLILLTISLSSAYAEGDIRDLAATEIRATSAMISWNCTYKDEQQYDLVYHVDGVDRDEVRPITDTIYRLRYLSPATTYVLTVSTNMTNARTITFTTPYAIDYVGYGYQLLETGLYKTHAGRKDYTALTGLSSKTLPGEVLDYDFHFLFSFQLAETDDLKHLNYIILLHLPNGDFYSIHDADWYTEDSVTVSEYWNLTETLTEIMRDYGGFPAGEYSLTAYLEGEKAAELTFTME
jgi:hypothetical protein